MSKVIQANNLTKKYEDIFAIKNINVEFEENKIYGLIGRNGSGKTTLLKLLTDQLLPSKGTINKKSNNVFLARESLGSSYEASSVLKVKEYFRLAKILIPTWDQKYCDNLIRRFELNTRLYYNKLSKGMKTMVGIITGLASKATVTFFDEPYVGLDPVAREILLEELNKEFIESKRTFIISTHLIYEFENLFEKVIILDKGEILIDKDIDEIHEEFNIIQGYEKNIEEFFYDFKIIKKEKIGAILSIVTRGVIDNKKLSKMKEKDIKVSKASLQDIFVNMTKGGNNNE